MPACGILAVGCDRRGNIFSFGIRLRVKFLVHRLVLEIGAGAAGTADEVSRFEAGSWLNVDIGGCEYGGVGGKEDLPDMEKDLRPERMLVGSHILKANFLLASTTQ